MDSPYAIGPDRTCHVCGARYRPRQYAEHAKAAGHYRGQALTHYRGPSSMRQGARNAEVLALLTATPRTLSQADVARRFGLTRERVRQILKQQGFTARDLPRRVKEHRPRVVPMSTCTVCGARYARATYRDHCFDAGHVHNRTREIYTSAQVREARRLVEQERLTWTEAADRMGIKVQRSNFGMLLRRAGHRGYGWHPALVDRNLEIVERRSRREPVAAVAAAVGVKPATVFNVMRAVRDAGGVEALMPRRRGGKEV